jgi:RNA polymerase-binding transcription factor DksA
MTTSQRIRQHLETELRRVKDRLGVMGMGANPPESAAATGQGGGISDFHEQAQASELKELAYETRSRLVKRLEELRRALDQLEQGSYGTCEECRRPIPERRLLAMPGATLCVPCQDHRERTTRGYRGLQ